MRTMMILYKYFCLRCDWEEEMLKEMKDRYEPMKEPCPNCKEMTVEKWMGTGGFTVPEGGCGNAANGYSSYYGDSENFKAGRKVYK